jgi:hypothetical protein
LLNLINLPPPSPGGRTGPPSSSNAPQGNTTPDLWTPGNPNLGAFVNPEYSAPRFQPQSGGANGSSTGSGVATSRNADSMTADVASGPLPGLTLLQGMAVVGPQGRRTEEYSRPASRSKPGGGSGVTAGIGAVPALCNGCKHLASRSVMSSHDLLGASHASFRTFMKQRLCHQPTAPYTLPNARPTWSCPEDNTLLPSPPACSRNRRACPHNPPA